MTSITVGRPEVAQPGSGLVARMIPRPPLWLQTLLHISEIFPVSGPFLFFISPPSSFSSSILVPPFLPQSILFLSLSHSMLVVLPFTNIFSLMLSSFFVSLPLVSSSRGPVGIRGICNLFVVVSACLVYVHCRHFPHLYLTIHTRFSLTRKKKTYLRPKRHFWCRLGPFSSSQPTQILLLVLSIHI
jgi:hypothetical protein